MKTKEKIFFLTAASILVIMLFAYIISYRYLYNTMYDDTLRRSQTTLELNNQAAYKFLQSVNQIAYQLAGDQTLGSYLNADEEEDIMTFYGYQTSFKKLFSNYISQKLFLYSDYTYRCTLLLSDQLAIASYFENEIWKENANVSSSIYSNTAVKDTFWYQQALEEGVCVFQNQETEEFCIAKSITNTYYRNSASSSRYLVLLVQIPLTEMERIFNSLSISEHSGYALFCQEGEALYIKENMITQEEYRQVYEFCKESGSNGHGIEVDISSGRYLASYYKMNYDMQFLYLTPIQDIEAGIFPLLKIYTYIYGCITLVALVGMFFLSDAMAKPLVKLSSVISQIQDTRSFDKQRLNVSSDKELVLLQNSFSQMIDHVNELILDIQKKNELQKQTQLKALQAQINPHFIFNALNAVNCQILLEGCTEIADSVDSIANIMRYSITDADSKVFIEQEMQNVKEFMAIYRQFHTNQIELQNHLSDASIQIPKFTIQPLVENAIYYAKPPKGEKLKITVTAWKEEKCSLIEVTDNGVSGNAEQLNKHLRYEDSGLSVSHGFGIRNVNERIQLWFASGSGLFFYNREDGSLTAKMILAEK